MALDDESTYIHACTSSQNAAAALVTLEKDEDDIPREAPSTPLESLTVPELK